MGEEEKGSSLFHLQTLGVTRTLKTLRKGTLAGSGGGAREQSPLTHGTRARHIVTPPGTATSHCTPGTSHLPGRPRPTTPQARHTSQDGHGHKRMGGTVREILYF